MRIKLIFSGKRPRIEEFEGSLNELSEVLKFQVWSKED